MNHPLMAEGKDQKGSGLFLFHTDESDGDLDLDIMYFIKTFGLVSVFMIIRIWGASTQVVY